MTYCSLMTALPRRYSLLSLINKRSASAPSSLLSHLSWDLVNNCPLPGKTWSLSMNASFVNKAFGEIAQYLQMQSPHNVKHRNTEILVKNIYCITLKDLGSHLFHGDIALVQPFNTRSACHCPHRPHLTSTEVNIQWTFTTYCEVIHTGLQKAAKICHGGNLLLHCPARGWVSWNTAQALRGSGR
jgi:hypothetical protein